MRTALVLCALLVACRMTETQQNTWVHDPGYYSIDEDGMRSTRYSRVEDFIAHGAGALGARERIVDAYATAQHAPPPDLELVVFAAELPPGIRLDGRVIEVAARAPYDVIGQYRLEYVLASAPRESEILGDLQRLASVTGGDAVVVELQHVGDRVRGVSGFVLRHREVAPPLASAPRRTVQLAYRAPAGCPSVEELRAEITARLGYAPWAESARLLDAAIVADHRGFAATVRLGEAAPRRLTGTSCRAVTAAMISIVVIRLDESR